MSLAAAAQSLAPRTTPNGRSATQRNEASLAILWGDPMAELENIKTWTERLGHSKLRSFTDEDGHYWLEQNAHKAAKWAKLARKGHEVAWEFDSPGAHTLADCS
jgi:hypothetical protein